MHERNQQPSASSAMSGGRLVRRSRDGVTWWTDDVLERERGVLLTFTERGGGVSEGPFASLDLAAHVGDDPAAVAENRRRLLAALDLSSHAHRLTLAEQPHGADVAVVGSAHAGAGARPGGPVPPVPGADALVTTEAELPLLLLFADCVPVVLVAASGGQPAVGVAHAGWRGAAAGVVRAAVEVLAAAASVDVSALRAYVGPHIRACHYEVGPEVLTAFGETSASIGRTSTGLDLGGAVVTQLGGAGVRDVIVMETCTAEETARFYSYRAEGPTGRHGALVAIRA